MESKYMKYLVNPKFGGVEKFKKIHVQETLDEIMKDETGEDEAFETFLQAFLSKPKYSSKHSPNAAGGPPLCVPTADQLGLLPWH
jgi:hypothetical protein